MTARSSRRRAAVLLVLAVAAAIGCVWCWVTASATVAVPPILDGEPWTTSVVYSAPRLTLALLLATVAGVLAVLGGARLRRGSRPGAPGPGAPDPGAPE